MREGGGSAKKCSAVQESGVCVCERERERCVCVREREKVCEKEFERKW